MRFNPKARLDTSRVRDTGRGGGGGGGMGGGPMRIPMPGGSKAGGGIGGVLIIILFIVLTQCVGGGTGGTGGGSALPIDTGNAGSDDSRMGDSERYANCDSGADANEDPDCARIAVENSLYAYWSQTLPEQAGQELRPAQMNTFSGGVDTGCGQATSQVGPFYCPADQQIYLDTTFFTDVLEGQLGGQGGDFVEPYVIGHEYGHHIQNLMGTMGKVRTQQGPQSDAVRLELQADCYAGMWTRAASGTTDQDGVQIFEALDQGDIEEALDSAKTVGDDRIQQKSGGRVDPEGWTHGSSEQRMAWFTTGYEQGTLEACDTFAAGRL
jgi:predicted metalloprotease